MTGNDNRLGEKIRQLRTQLGITQKDLAGDKITRNMLSLIESGNALPSLETTVHIAKKLGVSTDYLLSDEVSLSEATLSSALPTVRTLFNEKRYAACRAYAEKYCVGTSDELAMILAFCALAEAKTAVREGKLDTAAALIETAERYTNATAYPTDALRADISVFRSIAVNVQSPRLELDHTVYCEHLTNAASLELYMYLNEEINFPYSSDKFKRHLEARALTRQREYRRALTILEALEDSRTESDVTVFFLFRLYTDIETCHRELRNFESAYRYSSKRMSLLNAFHS